MKLSFAALALATLQWEGARAVDILRQGEKSHNIRKGSRRLEMTESCVLLLQDTQFEDHTSEEGLYCELQGADAEEHGHLILPLNGLDPALVLEHAGEMVSGYTDVVASGAIITSSGIELPNGKDVAFRPNERSKGKGRPFSDRRRRLDVKGDKKILAVRVRSAGDVTTTAGMSTISNRIFGTAGDVLNLKNQYEACSYDGVTITPGVAPAGTLLSVVDGVVEVTISDTVAGQENSVIRNAVTNALNAAGFSPSSNYDHVMYCLPPGTNGGWIAYAYINHWLSVYNDNWCLSPSGQMHEIGHNIGLAHAGEAGSQYADQSGMMGYSYSNDEAPVMCFNAPKNWQLGWYDQREFTLNPATSGGIVNLVGLASYGSSLPGQYVIVKLNTPSATDYYLSFNHQTGINSGTKEGLNQVLIHEQAGEGSSYAQSWLLAKLSATGSYTFSNFGNTGVDVTVTVQSISEGVATVQVSDPVVDPTAAPTASPTPAPTPECIGDGDCDDGDICNGVEFCDGAFCQSGTVLNCESSSQCLNDFCDSSTGCYTTPVVCDDGDDCTVDTCDALTGCVFTPTVGACCGNGLCEAGEDCNTCGADCGTGVTGGPSCGNNICEIGDGENCLTCPSDCNGDQGGKKSDRYCCGNGFGEGPIGCNDGRCVSGGNSCMSSQSPSSTWCCGNGSCELGESSESCNIDCEGITFAPTPSPTPTPTPPSNCAVLGDSCKFTSCCTGQNLSCVKDKGQYTCT